MTKIRHLLSGLPDKPGVYQVGSDAQVEILRASASNEHRHIKAVWPPETALESGFASGAAFVFVIDDGVCDTETGAVFDRDGAVIRESFGTNAGVTRYAGGAPDISSASKLDDGTMALPVATTRDQNYCRWWFDSMSKVYLAGRSTLTRSHDVVPFFHPERTSFHEQSVRYIDGVTVLPEGQRFIRGKIVCSPGLTFGGGQKINAIVSDFAAALKGDMLGEGASPDLDRSKIYVSRKLTSIRRVEDEDDVFAELEKLGFVRIDLSEMSLVEQVRCFSSASVIVSPHGAGLTNLLWASSGAKLVEIFPEGGVHGSAFLRLASLMDIDYFAFVGAAGLNRDKKLNPNNSDIIVDAAALAQFVAAKVLGSGARPSVGGRTSMAAADSAADDGAPAPGRSARGDAALAAGRTLDEIFPGSATLTLDALLALYDRLPEKTPGLAGRGEEAPVYDAEISAILAVAAPWFTPSPCAMAAGFLRGLVDLVRRSGDSRILEFGAGASTLVLPRVIAAGGVYLSIEDDERLAADVRKSLCGDDVAGAVDVVVPAFEPGDVIERDGKAFQAIGFSNLQKIVTDRFGDAPPELVIIRGPAGRRKWARYSALAGLIGTLKPGALVFLNDALRYRETSILDAWRAKGWVRVLGVCCVGSGVAVCEVI